MKKLIEGISRFRREVRPGRLETFARLALEQKPDALMIACSDSRVAPNVFASTDPGDLFIVRNVGNMVAPCGADGLSASDESEAAAIEFALLNLGVADIIVCGHSECGAMQALAKGRGAVEAPNLRAWLRHGEEALSRPALDPSLSPHDRISQGNVLLQLEHLRTYPTVRERGEAGLLRLHAWFFDIARINVHEFDPAAGRFVLMG